eukprot:65502-Rhodomonas_salina.3
MNASSVPKVLVSAATIHYVSTARRTIPYAIQYCKARGIPLYAMSVPHVASRTRRSLPGNSIQSGRRMGVPVPHMTHPVRSGNPTTVPDILQLMRSSIPPRSSTQEYRLWHSDSVAAYVSTGQGVGERLPVACARWKRE